VTPKNAIFLHIKCSKKAKKIAAFSEGGVLGLVLGGVLGGVLA
jgi:hypothetical protein